MERQDWPPVTDIHCHLLPGIDDGAKSWEDALKMARQAVDEGICRAILTPHQLGNYTHNRGADIRNLTNEFARLLAHQNIPLEVLPGADVRIDSDMIERLKTGDCLSLGDTGRYVLLELPHELYMPLEPVLNALQRIGMVGILSHPERNEGILRHPEVLPGLIERGCLMQITADSITGTFGKAPEECARMMVERGWVHFLATDAHSPRGRRPRMRAAMQCVEQITGPAYVEAIACVNPAAVAEGHDCPPLPAIRQRGLFAKLFGKRVA